MILLELRYYTDPGQAEDSVVAEVRGALTLLESLEDHEGQARAWRLLTLVNWEACRWGASETAVKRMLEQARLAGDFLLQARMLPALATCALYGPRPVSDAVEICQNILETTSGNRKAAAVTTRALALLEAMRGRFGVARELYRKSRATLDELGWHLHAALTSLSSGPIEMLAGDPAAAETELRRDYTALEKMGEKYYLSTTAGYLAAALLQQGRDEEADRAATVSPKLRPVG
jgi:hypothetical protein